MSFLAATANLNTLGKKIPRLASWSQKNPVTSRFFARILPTVIVAVIGMSVPIAILTLTKRGTLHVTESAVIYETMKRYWRFAFTNQIIFFCVGYTVIVSYLRLSPNQPILQLIASAFPQAAVFYVGYLIFVTGYYSFTEMALFPVRMILHFFWHRRAAIPRQRAFRTNPRFFDRHYWTGAHLIILTIAFIFTLLNPLVIPVAFLYFTYAVVIFKNQFLRSVKAYFDLLINEADLV